MANEPIVQQIKVDYDGAGVDQAAQGMQDVGQSTDAAGKQAESYAQQSERLQRELLDLATAEDRYQRSMKEGTTESEENRRASEQRREDMSRLTRQVAQAEDNQDRLNRELRESVTAHRAANDATDDGTRSLSLFTSWTDKAVSATSGFLVGLAGMQSVAAVLGEMQERAEAYNREVEHNVELTRQAAKERLDYVALKGVETPEDVAFLGQLAGFSGRPSGENARMLAGAQGQVGDKGDAVVKSIAVQVASLAQMTTAPMDELSDAMLAIYRQTGDTKSAGNLLQAALDKAPEPELAKVAKVIEEVLAVSGTIGGLDPGQGVGYAAAITGIGLDTNVASTSFTTSIKALLGDPFTDVYSNRGVNDA